jgi:hypothetical protein
MWSKGPRNELTVTSMQRGQDLPSRYDEGGLRSEIRALKLLVEQMRHSGEPREQRESTKKNGAKKIRGKKVVAL